MWMSTPSASGFTEYYLSPLKNVHYHYHLLLDVHHPFEMFVQLRVVFKVEILHFHRQLVQLLAQFHLAQPGAPDVVLQIVNHRLEQAEEAFRQDVSRGVLAQVFRVVRAFLVVVFNRSHGTVRPVVVHRQEFRTRCGAGLIFVSTKTDAAITQQNMCNKSSMTHASCRL